MRWPRVYQDKEFIHAVFAQLASSRKLGDRLKSDFDLDDSLEDLNESFVKLEPLKIGFDNKKYLSKKKSKKSQKSKSQKKK